MSSVTRPLPTLPIASALWLLTAAAPLADLPPPPIAPPSTNPALAEVTLPALAGWNASLVLDNRGGGIWTVEAFQVFPHTGTLEIVGLDDLGRVQVCSGYSGKWSPTTVVSDGKWLGGLAHGDVDPRIAGSEIYTGSQQGNLYQVVAWPHGILDFRLIAHLPGREIHTIVAGDLDAANAGPELILFTRPGGVFRVTPSGPHGTFETTSLGAYEGRVRQAIVLPNSGNEPPSIATVSHNGKLEILRLTAQGPTWQTLYQDAMGLGRIAVRPASPNQPQVLYSTQDDGRILRHEQRNDGPWLTEVLYHGPQGPRGVVAGAFAESPTTETIAVFGYSRRVELLTRTANGWRAETIFEDLDKGHWLAAAELDGRNATLELITSGYSGRIVQLARPPGFGRTELALTPLANSQAALESFDSSTPPSLPAGWKPTITGEGNPIWTVVASDMASSAPHVLRQSGSVPKPSFPVCLLESALIQNGFVETKFRTISGEIDQAAGVVWRARDAMNYYVCRANALENNVVLYRVKDAQRTALNILGRQGGYGVETKVAPAQWHSLRVAFAGNRFQVSINGHELFIVEDNTFQLPGHVGVWTKADSVTLFDDFRFGP